MYIVTSLRRPSVVYCLSTTRRLLGGRRVGRSCVLPLRESKIGTRGPVVSEGIKFGISLSSLCTSKVHCSLCHSF